MTPRLLGKRYLSVMAFAETTGMKPDTVRWRLERGLIRGRKRRGRWQIVAAEAKK